MAAPIGASITFSQIKWLQNLPSLALILKCEAATAVEWSSQSPSIGSRLALHTVLQLAEITRGGLGCRPCLHRLVGNSHKWLPFWRQTEKGLTRFIQSSSQAQSWEASKMPLYLTPCFFHFYNGQLPHLLIQEDIRRIKCWRRISEIVFKKKMTYKCSWHWCQCFYGKYLSKKIVEIKVPQCVSLKTSFHLKLYNNNNLSWFSFTLKLYCLSSYVDYY